MSGNKVNGVAGKFALLRKPSKNQMHPYYKILQSLRNWTPLCRKWYRVGLEKKMTVVGPSEFLSSPAKAGANPITDPTGSRRFNFWRNRTREPADWMILGLVEDGSKTEKGGLGKVLWTTYWIRTTPTSCVPHSTRALTARFLFTRQETGRFMSDETNG